MLRKFHLCKDVCFVFIIKTYNIYPFSGNDVIHELTLHGTHELKVVLLDFNNITKYALYNNFRVAEESSGYRLFVWDYSGTAGSLTYSYLEIRKRVIGKQYRPGSDAT